METHSRCEYLSCTHLSPSITSDHPLEQQLVCESAPQHTVRKYLILRCEYPAPSSRLSAVDVPAAFLVPQGTVQRHPSAVSERSSGSHQCGDIGAPTDQVERIDELLKGTYTVKIPSAYLVNR